MSFNKIFEIGIYKTGTSSLGKAYEILGYRHMGWNADAYDEFVKTNNYEILYKIIDNYDAFEDGPWHDCDYKILDIKYPNSKFIILDRDNEEWIKSVENHSSPLHNSNNIKDKYLEYGWLYDKELQKEKMIMFKNSKYDEIKNYFKNRKNDLLVMNIQDGWKPLCIFLGKEIPIINFPVLNISKKINKVNKIFDIGIFIGCSLNIIFKILGYNHKSDCNTLNELYNSYKNIDLLSDIIDNYDSFDGNPWREIDYKLIDMKYPNSKFIFSYLEDDIWINNLEKIFSPKYNINNLNETFLVKDWIINRDEYIKNLLNYKSNKLKNICEYFRNKNNILYYNLEGGWSPICNFLELKTIKINFPISNF